MVTRRRYKVVIEQEPDGRYSVHAPALPGCASWARTVDEALRNIREAIALYVESLSEDGQPIPAGDREVRVEDVEVTV